MLLFLFGLKLVSLSHLNFSLFTSPCDWLDKTGQGMSRLGRKLHPEGCRQEPVCGL